MNNEKRVTVLEPINIKALYTQKSETPKLKVAAYARVSTEQDEQQSSYEAQVDYYRKYIRSNPEWEFVGIYADEGITGTNTKKRDGFNSMINDAKAGKIDLILTKSISRFARNTVDTLQTVRELSALNIEVIFEKEGIRTLDKQCEVMLTIMSSLAQEESRSISENVRWGMQKSMQDGNISLPYKRFLGYKKGDDGRPEIVPEEAEVVRDIYRMFLDGKTIRTIADELTRRGIKTPGGKDNWAVSTVKSILSNEKYKGDALRQKTYTVDYLSKTVRKNNGEVKQYYVSNSHDAIVDEDTFNLVQAELARRSKFKSALRDNSVFSTKIICGECGYFYGRKTLHSTSEKHRKVVWYCNRRYDGEEKCSTPSISEPDIEKYYLIALKRLLSDKESHIADCNAKLNNESALAQLKEDRFQAEITLETLMTDIQALVQENARKSQDQQKYREKFNKLVERIDKQKTLIADLKAEELKMVGMREKLNRFIEALARCEGVMEFTEQDWGGLVECVVVKPDTLTFEFKDNSKIEVAIQP